MAGVKRLTESQNVVLAGLMARTIATGAAPSGRDLAGFLRLPSSTVGRSLGVLARAGYVARSGSSWRVLADTEGRTVKLAFMTDESVSVPRSEFESNYRVLEPLARWLNANRKEPK